MITSLLIVGAIFIPTALILYVSAAQARDGHEDFSGFHFDDSTSLMDGNLSENARELRPTKMVRDLQFPVS